MSDNRKQVLGVEILKALVGCDGMAMPQPSLVQMLQLIVVPVPRESEVMERLDELEARRLVVSLPGNLDGPMKFMVTDSGRGTLRGMGK